jgi:O-acetylhomoserine/O-acetylserine sulfhydrylase-like pyridoxal-dependent enzyme
VTEDLVRLGVTYDFVDGDDPAEWKAKLRANTRAFYAETISNPLLGVSDLEGIAAFAREHGILSIIDNTFASPVNFRPLEHGFDYVQIGQTSCVLARGPSMGVMSNTGTVRTHPLQKSRHILYTFSLPVILPVCRSIRPRTVL